MKSQTNCLEMVTHLVAIEGFKPSEVGYLSVILTDLCEVAQKRGASDAIKRIVDAYDLKGPKAKLPPKESLPALMPNITSFYSGVVVGKNICWVLSCVAESLNPAFSGKRFTRTFKDHEVILPSEDSETVETLTVGVSMNTRALSIELQDAVNPLKLLAEGLNHCASLVSSPCDDADIPKPTEGETLACCKPLSGLTRGNVANITRCVYAFAEHNAYLSYERCVQSMINAVEVTKWNRKGTAVNFQQEISGLDPENLIAYFAELCGVDVPVARRLPLMLRDSLGDKQKHFSPIMPNKAGYWASRFDIISTLGDAEVLLPKLGGDRGILKTKAAQKLLTNSREIYEYILVTCLDALNELVDA